MENQNPTCAPSGVARTYSDAQRVVGPDVARGPELAPMTVAPRQFGTFRGRMKMAMQRIRAGTKKDRQSTRTARVMKESGITLPPYIKLAEGVDEETSIQDFNETTGLEPNGSAASKTNKNAVSKPNGDAAPKPNEDPSSKPRRVLPANLLWTRRNHQKPIKSNARKPEKSTVAKSIPRPLWEIDYSGFSCPRLTELTRNKVDRVKLLRSVLVFVMFVTFFADFDKIKTETGSLFPWRFTISTPTDADASKIWAAQARTAVLPNFSRPILCVEPFAWDLREITHELCSLVRHLERMIRDNRWFNARREHKDLLTQLVLKPAEDLMIQADYALEILGVFRRYTHKDGFIDYYTLVDYWEPPNLENLPSDRLLDLGDTLASHAFFIASLNLQEKQQSELENAMAKYITERHLDKLQMSEKLKRTVLAELEDRPHGTCCWPMTDGYMDLFRMLGQTDGSLWRNYIKYR